jgi:hypothetical protein
MLCGKLLSASSLSLNLSLNLPVVSSCPLDSAWLRHRRNERGMLCGKLLSASSLDLNLNLSLNLNLNLSLNLNLPPCLCGETPCRRR